MRATILALLLSSVPLATIGLAAEPERSAVPTSPKVLTGKERLSDKASGAIPPQPAAGEGQLLTLAVRMIQARLRGLRLAPRGIYRAS